MTSSTPARKSLSVLLDEADASQLLDLHSRLATLPFGGRAPAGFDWRAFIDPATGRWRSGAAAYRPRQVVDMLSVGDYNVEGLIAEDPGLTRDMCVAAILWGAPK